MSPSGYWYYPQNGRVLVHDKPIWHTATTPTITANLFSTSNQTAVSNLDYTVTTQYGMTYSNAYSIVQREWERQRVQERMDTIRQFRSLDRWAFVNSETPEQRLIREEARLALEAEKHQAAETAERLLLSILTREQADEYQETETFTVVGSEGGLYEVKKGWVANVTLLGPDGQPLTRLCAHTDSSVPTGDNVAAQVLAIKTNERRFLEVANRHPVLRAA